MGVVFLPSYSAHRRVYEIIGLSAGYCFVIDRIVDEDPPLVRDVFPDVGSMEVLPRHFGYRDREFPYMAKFVLDRFGYEGLRCLAAHFVLDHIEGLVERGFDSEMISNEVSALVESYIGEAGASISGSGESSQACLISCAGKAQRCGRRCPGGAGHEAPARGCSSQRLS